MEIVSVAIVHRHGARFPYKSSSENLSFPNSHSFWSKYRMMLTPVGYQQLFTLGQELALQYPNLLSDVRAYSSYTSRTILSAKALLAGMLPDTPIYITHNGDRCKGNYLGIDLGIELQVEQSKEHDTLFHLGKYDSEVKRWKKSNINHSPLLIRLSKDRECINLFDKLYTMTGCEKMSPLNSNLTRLSSITEYLTLIRYARCSNTLLIPNKFLLFLTKDEIKLIEYLANVVYSHHYTSHSGSTNEGIGVHCSGLLLSTILSHFHTAQRSGAYSLRVFSGHDTTLLALSSALGLSVDAPNFSAYYIFELYKDGSVGIKYNPEPDIIRLKDLIGKRWVHNDTTVAFGSLNNVDSSGLNGCSLTKLGKIVDLDSYIKLRNLLHGESNNINIEKVNELFKYYDIDKNGYLNLPEFKAMIRRFHIDHITDKQIEHLFDMIAMNGKVYPEDLMNI